MVEEKIGQYVEQGKNIEFEDAVEEITAMLNYMDELQTIWDESLVNATKNYMENKAIKNTNTESDGVKYSLVEKTDNGIEVYKTSEEAKNLSYKECKASLLNKIISEYTGRTAKFNKNGQVYYATLNETSARKGVYGDKKSDKQGYNAKVNIGADGNYFELVVNSLYSGSSLEQGKTTNTDIHKNVNQWDYYQKAIQSDGKLFDVLINVADKGNKDQASLQR